MLSRDRWHSADGVFIPEKKQTSNKTLNPKHSCFLSFFLKGTCGLHPRNADNDENRIYRNYILGDFMAQESDKTPNGSHMVWKPGSLLFTTYSLNTLVFFSGLLALGSLLAEASIARQSL